MLGEEEDRQVRRLRRTARPVEFKFVRFFLLLVTRDRPGIRHRFHCAVGVLLLAGVLGDQEVGPDAVVPQVDRVDDVADGGPFDPQSRPPVLVQPDHCAGDRLVARQRVAHAVQRPVLDPRRAAFPEEIRPAVLFPVAPQLSGLDLPRDHPGQLVAAGEGVGVIRARGAEGGRIDRRPAQSQHVADQPLEHVVRPFQERVGRARDRARPVVLNPLHVGGDLVGEVQRPPRKLDLERHVNDERRAPVQRAVVLDLHLLILEPGPVAAHLAGDVEEIHHRLRRLLRGGRQRRARRVLRHVALLRS